MSGFERFKLRIASTEDSDTSTRWTHQLLLSVKPGAGGSEMGDVLMSINWDVGRWYYIHIYIYIVLVYRYVGIYILVYIYTPPALLGIVRKQMKTVTISSLSHRMKLKV